MGGTDEKSTSGAPLDATDQGLRELEQGQDIYNVTLELQ